MSFESPDGATSAPWRPKITVLTLMLFGAAAAGWMLHLWLLERKMDECKHNVKRIGRALEDYFRDHQEYPENQNQLIPDFLDEFPECPIVGCMTYRTSFGPHAGRNPFDNPDYFIVECCGDNHGVYGMTPNFPAYDSISGFMVR